GLDDLRHASGGGFPDEEGPAVEMKVGIDHLEYDPRDLVRPIVEGLEMGLEFLEKAVAGPGSGRSGAQDDPFESVPVAARLVNVTAHRKRVAEIQIGVDLAPLEKRGDQSVEETDIDRME